MKVELRQPKHAADRPVHPVRRFPNIGVRFDANDPNIQNLDEIHLNGGIVKVDIDRSELDPLHTLRAVQAGIGFSNSDIAEENHFSPNTIKTSMKYIFRILDITSRRAITPVLMEIGALECVQPGKLLELTDPESTTLQYLAAGHGRKTILEDTGIIETEYRNQIRQLKVRTGLVTEEQIILGALMSGEISPSIR